jgi:hypothetical protein
MTDTTETLRARAVRWLNSRPGLGIPEMLVTDLLESLIAESQRADTAEATSKNLICLEEGYRASERLMLRRLSDTLTGGNASQWEEICHAAEAVVQRVDTAEQALVEARKLPCSCGKGDECSICADIAVSGLTVADNRTWRWFYYSAEAELQRCKARAKAAEQERDTLREMQDNLVACIEGALQPEFEAAQKEVFDSGNQGLHPMIEIAVERIREKSEATEARLTAREGQRLKDFIGGVEFGMAFQASEAETGIADWSDSKVNEAFALHLADPPVSAGSHRGEQEIPHG